MILYGKSDIGLVRSKNQDAFCTATINENCSFAAVFDGMGSLSSGARASQDACKMLSEYLTVSLSENFLKLSKDPSENEIKDLLTDAVAFTSHHIFSHALHETGTTVALVLILYKKAYICHVGDSRVYGLFDKKLKLLTRDHTYTQYLLSRGEISESEVKTHPQSHVLTKALGTDNFVLPDISVCHLSKISSFLICSDGLTLHLSDKEIENIMTSDITPYAKTDLLISSVHLRGARDNVTVVIIDKKTKN